MSIQQQEYTTGSGNWTCPAGVYFVDVLIVAGGGASFSSSGGGGGEVVSLHRYPVTPTSAYAYVVGAGGASQGASGASSSFNGIVAEGGYGGPDGINGGNGGGTGSATPDVTAPATQPYAGYGMIIGHDGTNYLFAYGGLGGNQTCREGSMGMSSMTPHGGRCAGGGGGAYNSSGNGGVGGASAFATGGNSSTINGGGGASYGPGANADAAGAANTGAGGGGCNSAPNFKAGGSGYILISWYADVDISGVALASELLKVPKSDGAVVFNDDAVAGIVAGLFAGVVENSKTFVQMIRGMAAVLLGKSAGGGTDTLTFQDNADTKARVTATVDANGNRSAVSTDLS